MDSDTGSDAETRAAPRDAAAQEELVRKAREIASRCATSAPTQRTFGPFTILDKLGEGGMGVVYRAFDKNLKRHLAVKILGRAASRSQEFVERFTREARLLASLRHDGLATVFAFGDHEGQLYMALELVDGRSIAQLIEQKGTIPPRRAAGIMVQALDALEVVHEAGVVHRDVKPGNVMVVRRGGSDRVKLLDFGVAKVPPGGEDWKQLTDTDMVLGTPQYMAPEIIKGGGIGAAADIYSAGIVLYEMLVGRPPFGGRVHEIFMQHINGHPAPPAMLRPELPEPLNEAVLRALSKRPEDRFGSAKAFAEALETVVDGMAEVVEPGSSDYSLPPSPKDTPTVAAQRPAKDARA